MTIFDSDGSLELNDIRLLSELFRLTGNLPPNILSKFVCGAVLYKLSSTVGDNRATWVVTVDGRSTFAVAIVWIGVKDVTGFDAAPFETVVCRPFCWAQDVPKQLEKQFPIGSQVSHNQYLKHCICGSIDDTFPIYEAGHYHQGLKRSAETEE